MSKFCSNCGNMLDDNAIFCGKCGTKAVTEQPTPQASPVADAPAAEPAPQIPVAPQPNNYVPQPTYNEQGFEAPVVPAKKKNPLLLWGIIGLLVIGIGVAAFFIFGGGPEYEDSIEDKLYFNLAGYYENATDIVPQQYANYYAQEYGQSIEQYLNQLVQGNSSLAQVNKDELDFDIDITNEEELNANELSQINSYLSQRYGFTPNSVSEGYKISVNSTVHYQGKSQSIPEVGYIMYIDGNWYSAIINFSGDNVTALYFTLADQQAG